MLNVRKIKIFGITFFDANYKEIKKMLDRGGLLVLPSGPGMSTIDKDKNYYNALKNSDIALFDSGYLCLLLRILKGIKVKKFSGFIFFKDFINSLKNENKKKIFLVEPNKKQLEINKKFLNSKNIYKIYQYIAPIYQKEKIKDYKLLKKIQKIKPKYVVINLGGGVQEVLGSFLKNNINYKVSIICTGAAISYFTKQQAPLNVFLDKIYLGWLIRIIFNPFVFLPRYLSAFRLIFIVNKI